MSLVNHFAAYSNWRENLSGAIRGFRDWLLENELADAQSELRLNRLMERLKEDRLYVAFVAEFSRGKSELINAIFFSDYGKRMLPSAAGRTTMCPTELLYDPSRPPYIEFLPVHTRDKPTSISEYKQFSNEWITFPLDVRSAEAMQDALRQVSQVTRVLPEEAKRLGFQIGVDENGTEHCQVGSDGMVEIPRWRHAVINFPHPLLKQGLVILDTPGLNAIGTEPELTLSLLPNAHAVLFVLAADTGVTQSDLTLWRQHISGSGTSTHGRLIAMNKIDGLWDELKIPEQINSEIRKQATSCANILGLPPEQIFPVSAQKGLVAKVNNDLALLQRSHLQELEEALSSKLISNKRNIVGENTASEFNDIGRQVKNLLDSRLSALREQMEELTSLRGKNQGVVEYMMGKVKAEKEEFEAGLLRYYAVRSVFSTLTNNLFGYLGLDSLRNLTHTTREEMQSAAFSKNLSEAMRDYFDRVRSCLSNASAEIREILGMMEVIYKKFTDEHGLVLNSAPTHFSLLRFEKEVDRLEEWCETNLSTAVSLLTHEKRQIIERFFDEVAAQIRLAFEHANQDADTWLKAVMAPMETQVREHQIHLKRRLESIKRIHQATDTLEDRIGELEHVESTLINQGEGLVHIAQRISDLINMPEEALENSQLRVA